MDADHPIRGSIFHADLHPEGLTREQLAALVGMTATGGTFNTHVRALINHELAIPGRGKRLRLAEALRS